MGTSPTRLESSVFQELADAIRESERRALAHALHDTVIQPLMALITSFECVQSQAQTTTGGIAEAQIGVWKGLAREAIDSLRGALAGLREHPHAEAGLPEALQTYLMPQVGRRGLRVALDVTKWPDELPFHITTNLYLAIREALTNVEKHAHASLVRVVLRATPRMLSVIISDNGIGMQVGAIWQSAGSASSGLGFESMRARVQAVGGKLTLTSAPGQGMRIVIRVPCPEWVSGRGAVSYVGGERVRYGDARGIRGQTRARGRRR